jgi:nitrate reductase NapE component
MPYDPYQRDGIIGLVSLGAGFGVWMLNQYMDPPGKSTSKKVKHALIALFTTLALIPVLSSSTNS